MGDLKFRRVLKMKQLRISLFCDSRLIYEKRKETQNYLTLFSQLFMATRRAALRHLDS